MNRDQEYDALKYKHDQAQRRLQRLEETVKLLEQQLKEKRDQIAVLQRVSNVVLWEREKKRLLENCRYQQESLETDLAQVQEKYATNKDNSKRTIQSLQEQIKKYELMIELELRQSKEACYPDKNHLTSAEIHGESFKAYRMKLSSLEQKILKNIQLEYLKELEKVRQELHVKRMMVARLEKEVTEQQKCYVGILRGLRVDYRNLMQKFVTEENKSLWKHLSAMFDRVYGSCAAGNLTSLQASLPAHYIGLTSDIISSPLLLRKKRVDATGSSISLESLSHGSSASHDDNNNDDNGEDDVSMEENGDGASSLPTLASSAKTANLTGNTTNFIVEAKERLHAHNQHMLQIFPNKSLSETELVATPATPKHLTNRQGTNSMGAKKDTSQNSTSVSPLIRKRTTKMAWKLDGLRSSSFTSPPRANSRSSPSGRSHTEAPVLTKSSPDSNRYRNKMLRSSMSQISLSYQDITKERTTAQQSQRKSKALGHSSLPLPRKDKAKTQSPATTTKQFDDKVTPCLVDKEKGILKTKDVLTHFPHLTEEQVRSHFENFMKYDTNNDYTLDFNELRVAVTQVFNFHHGVVSKQELMDVLEEVNADYSNSIEFYEYLLLSKKCLDLTGTSDLFRNQLIVQQQKKFAEMCSIQ